MQTFKGRSVIAGEVTGKILVSQEGFNVLASYMGVLTNPEATEAICTDQNNPFLYKKKLNNEIICIPQVIGSTTAGMIIQAVAALGLQPSAMLFSESAESLAISGVLLAEIWEDTKIVTIDGLGTDFLESIEDNQRIEIFSDGTVNVYA